MTSYLVTGGCGFIGVNVVSRLVSQGARVRVLDDLSLGKREDIEHLGVDLQVGDIRDVETVQRACQGAEVVVHLAAHTRVVESVAKPRLNFEVNALGTLNVLEACREAEVKKVILASTGGAILGEQTPPVHEGMVPRPVSAYGASKLAGEKYCTSYANAYGMDITCLRYFSVYGPRGRPDQVLYAFAEKAARQEGPTIYGDGSYSRDFTYVSDVASATILALYSDADGGRVLNIGFGKDYKVIDVARKVVAHYGGDQKIQFVKQYQGDFSRTLCDNDRARRVLGWRPATQFDEGLALFLDWFDTNRLPVLKGLGQFRHV